MIFAHSRRDLWLVSVALLQTINLIGMFFAFEAEQIFETWILGVLFVFLTCTNFQCVAHNFIHHPFFKNNQLNKIFAIWNTLLIGVPQTIYRFHHLNHHRYNNDLKNEKGSTEDYSSIYRFSRTDEPESALIYALLGPFRTDLALLYKDGKDRGQRNQILAETVIMLGLLGLASYLWPVFIFACYFPAWYAGQVVAYLENYFEHYGAKPGNRKTDSVSCYNRLYNLIWFNNGYHQEHHYRPQTHWTEVPTLTKELEGAPGRMIVSGAHWFNWPIWKIQSTRKAHDTGSVF